MQVLLGWKSSFIPIFLPVLTYMKNRAPYPFQSAELTPFCGIYQGIKASLNCWPSQSRRKKEWIEDIWYLSIMVLPPHFQMLNISIFKWLVILLQSFFRQSFLCYSTSALDLFFMLLLGKVSTGDRRNRKILRGQIPALKCQALSLSLLWSCCCYLGRNSPGPSNQV